MNNILSSIYQGQSLKKKAKPNHNIQVWFFPKNTNKCFLSRFCSHLRWKYPFPFYFPPVLSLNDNRITEDTDLCKSIGQTSTQTLQLKEQTSIILKMLRVGWGYLGGVQCWGGKIQFFKLTLQGSDFQEISVRVIGIFQVKVSTYIRVSVRKMLQLNTQTRFPQHVSYANTQHKQVHTKLVSLQALPTLND